MHTFYAFVFLNIIGYDFNNKVRKVNKLKEMQ